MPHKLRFAPFAAILAIAAAGCGSSGGSARAQLVAQADPVCKQVAAQRLAANTAVGKVGTSTAKTLQALARLAPAVAVDEHQAVARLRALKAPSSLADDWQLLLTGMQQLADDTTRIAADSKAKNYKEVEAITSSGRRLRQQLTVIAARDGFSYCGRTS
jgi:hypothetical protein